MSVKDTNTCYDGIVTKKEVIVGYKGFDKNLKCRDFQYKIGKTYKEDKADLCSAGFHYCEYPLDVFNYYSPSEGSRYCTVEPSGISKQTDNDSKRAAKTLKISAEIGIHGLVDAAIKFILEKSDNTKSANGELSTVANTGNQSAATNTGDWSAATNTGNRSAATNTGNWSAATNTGNRSAASVEGKESIAIAVGFGSKASGAKGCWITLAEWAEKNGKYHIVDVQTVKVDGKKIKANTFYSLVDGRFVEA